MNFEKLLLHANFNDNTRISWTNIINSFFQLSNINPDIEENNQQQIAGSLIRVILATAESIRFIEVQNLIINNINNYWMNFTPIINNWSRMTTNAISYIENGSLLNFPNLNDILVFTSLISDYFWQCNTKPRISSDEYCYENNLYINNVEYGDYFQNSYFDKKKVFDLDINITRALKIKNEQEFKINFSNVFLKDYKSNYKAMTKNEWFYDFELNASEFKINDWSTKIISTVEDRVGAAHINGQIYSNYRLYKDKKNELHMQIEIWMQGSRNWTNSKMWIWLETGYLLSFNNNY